MNTVEKIKELNDNIPKLSQFEKNFVQDNFARLQKFADDVTFSEKQTALIDRIYQERVTESRAPKVEA